MLELTRRSDPRDPAFFFEMPALDMERAKKFYERTFGWKIEPSYENFYFAQTTESDASRNPQSPVPSTAQSSGRMRPSAHCDY
jgi:hypothetical protein